MSRDLTKMNLIAIVQQLSDDDIEFIETYIGMIEKENQQLKRNCNIGIENLNFYKQQNQSLKSTLEEIRSYVKASLTYPVSLNSYVILDMIDNNKKED